MLQENEIVTAHGVGAFGRNPSSRRTREVKEPPTPFPKIGKGETVFFLWCFRGAKKTIMSHFYTKSNMFLTEMRHR